MKKYMVLWGAMFFVVLCVSLYLMMETVTSNIGKGSPELDAKVVEMKIANIQADIVKNHDTIEEIKKYIRQMSKDNNKEAIDKLRSILDKTEHVIDAVNVPPKASVAMETFSPRNKVKYDQKVCSLADAPVVKSDVQMVNVYDLLKFDNPDGGVWKQGWNVKYEAEKWNKNNMLHVYVVPHTHCDPGWVKKFMDYYEQQVKEILDSMLTKLESNQNYKFMYAEMSFFSIWWEEIDQQKRKRVKKLIENGQFEIVTGGWVMTDEANAHYAAMVDQLIEGNQWIHGVTGAKPESGWAIDPFGHSPTMAYILKRSGIKNMLIQRVHYSVKKQFARDKNLEFMWRQQWDQDGTTDMLCHMMPFYSYDVPHTCGPDPKICCQFDFARLPPSKYSCPWRVPPKEIDSDNVAHRAKILIDQYKKKASLYRTNALFIPVGDDFRYDNAGEWNKQFNNYEKIFEYLDENPGLGVKAQFGTLSDYFNKLYELTDTTKGHHPTGIPVLSGDFFTYADRDDHYWSGYYTSRPFHKHLDRVLEANLRSAEIAFSLATAYQSKLNLNNLPYNRLMNKLINARRSLGLFQHHDGITGTAKDFVVTDYGERLLEALMDSKQVLVDAVTFLSLKDKSKYSKNQVHFFNMDESRASHDSLPKRTVLKMTSEQSRVLIYNSLGHAREQVVKIYVSSPHIEVATPSGDIFTTQTDPYWVSAQSISDDVFKVSFVAKIPALGYAQYLVREVSPGKNSHNSYAAITFYNTEEDVKIKPPFSLEIQTNKDAFSIESGQLKAEFSPSDGMLKSVTTKSDGVKYKAEVNFQSYGTRHGKDKSGAYLFLPDGPASEIREHMPIVRVIRGPVVSEVSVQYKHAEHVARVHNSPGTDGTSIDMFNLVDIRDEINFELGLKIKTDIQNADRQFYVDLNGFQMQKHKTLDKLPMQANFYPMPASSYIEDDKTRFTLISAQALGMASLKQGEIEVVLDRRLNQDDERGLGQGVRDNRITPNRFALLFEPRGKPAPKDKMTGYLSLQAHLTHLHLVHSPHILPQSSNAVDQELLREFSPLAASLPCDTHLLNLRTMQNFDGSEPKKEAALLLHRMGFDCSIANTGFLCEDSQGKVTFKDIFKEVQFNKVTETSLTLLHDKEEVSLASTYQLLPMEIHTFRVHWH